MWCIDDIETVFVELDFSSSSRAAATHLRNRARASQDKVQPTGDVRHE